MLNENFSYEIFENKYNSIFAIIDNLLLNGGWKNHIDLKSIFNIAKHNFEKISNGKTKKNLMVRLAGQSGSGKTTQLLPSAQEFFKKQNLNPINIAVRNFAILHPQYEEILTTFGKSEMRERTNGFALICLCFSLIFAIEKGFDILFEVTFLSKEFENFISNLLAKNNYKCLYLLLAVNKSVSDYLIEKRNLSNGIEAKRVVFEKSKESFYNWLKESVEFYSISHPSKHVVMWDAYKLFPIYDGNFGGVLELFLKSLENNSTKLNNEDELRTSKIEFLQNLKLN